MEGVYLSSPEHSIMYEHCYPAIVVCLTVTNNTFDYSSVLIIAAWVYWRQR